MIAFSHVVFLIPNKIASGGFMSLAMLVFYSLKLNLIFEQHGVGVGIVTILMNIPLLIYAYRLFGRDYVLKTIYGTLTLPIFTMLISTFIKYVDISKYFSSMWVPVLLGSIIIGIAIGCAAAIGGSSGGVDIIGRIINYFNNGISIGAGIALSKMVIILISAHVFDVEHALYAILSAFLMGVVVDISKKTFENLIK